MEHPFLMFLDHTQRRTTVGGTPLDEYIYIYIYIYIYTHTHTHINTHTHTQNPAKKSKQFWRVRFLLCPPIIQYVSIFSWTHRRKCLAQERLRQLHCTSVHKSMEVFAQSREPKMLVVTTGWTFKYYVRDVASCESCDATAPDSNVQGATKRTAYFERKSCSFSAQHILTL